MKTYRIQLGFDPPDSYDYQLTLFDNTRDDDEIPE